VILQNRIIAAAHIKFALGREPADLFVVSQMCLKLTAALLLLQQQQQQQNEKSLAPNGSPDVVD
jgi:hypothetical protein